MKAWLVVLIAGLQTAWIVGSALRQEYHLATDPVVRLEARTADLRDLRRAGHVSLRYEINEVPLALFEPKPPKDPAVGEVAFVVLEKQGDFHQPIRASLEWPALRPGQVAIRGRVDYARRPRDPGAKRTADTQVRIRYGLERFYVSEGVRAPRGDLTVDAAVSSDGRPLLKEVYLDGRPFREAVKP